MSRFATGMFAALAAASAIACAGEASREPSSSGSSSSVWGETTLVEELSIGVDVGDPEYMFGFILDVTVAPDGRIFVAQLQPLVIREYDADGNFVRDLGGEGQGPGEYQSPSIEVLGDGRLVVWDFRSDRLSIFARDGSFEDSVVASSTIGGEDSLQLDTEDNFYVRARGETQGPVTSELEIPVELRRYSLAGELLGTVSTPAPGPEGTDFMVREGFQSFTVATYWAWSRLSYLVVGRNDRYEIELRKPEGVVRLRRDVDRVPLTGEERDEWQAFSERFVEINPNIDEVDPLPDNKPFFRGLRVGNDGRIWVDRYVAAEKRDDIEPLPDAPDRPLLTWREPPTFDVFEPDGTFLGTVVLPHDFRAHGFRGEKVWGVHTDADGVERVKRLRVASR